MVSPAETGLGRIGKYDLLEEIGKGGMACVYRAVDTGTGTVVAVKKVRTEGASLDEAAIRREMDIYGRLRQIASPHILVVLDMLREAGEYALVTEYADGGSLWDLLGGEEATEETRKPLDAKSVRAIAGDMLAGLAALHEHGIVHRDIKPQNILRCDDLWKIADFGISKLMNNPVTGYTFQGASRPPGAAGTNHRSRPTLRRTSTPGAGRRIHVDRADERRKDLVRGAGLARTSRPLHRFSCGEPPCGCEAAAELERLPG